MEDENKPLPYGVENGRRVLYVTYKGDCRMVHVDGHDQLFTTRTLADTLYCVRPGDILQLLPGKYWPPILYDEDAGGTPACRPIKLSEINGWPDMPITIRGMGAATLLDGGLGGVPHDSLLPEMKHFAFFKLADCSWIEFENFHVENCWPSFLYMESSSYVTVRNVVAKDSRYLVYARGQSVHHILLENIRWRQDPTSSMWRDLLWLDSKRKRYFYYNGGLFGSVGISGSVVLRGNTICDTFNAMRMKVDKKKPDSTNCNVEIYDNTFLRTRDNPVEPENAATNWWVHHNRIHNAHAWFSLDGVGGGFWYYFANTGWITDKPSSKLDPSRGGKVYKFDPEGPYPDKPNFFFNNSYSLYNSLIKEGVSAHLLHANNAVLFRDTLPALAPQRECGPCLLPLAVRRPFQDDPAGDNRFMGDGFMPDGWDPTLSFDFDLTNKPWPPNVVENAQEKQGIYAADASFIDHDLGDLRLVGGPPKGCPVTLRAGLDWPAPEDWTSGPDTPIGAYGADAELVDGPAFAFFTPKKDVDEGYVERPRLVRLVVKEDALALTFSFALAGDGPVKARVKAGQDKFWAEAVVCGRVLTVALPAPLAGRKLKKVWLPDTLKGSNGQYATLWSSVFAGLRLYAAGRVPGVTPPKPVCFCNCGEEI